MYEVNIDQAIKQLKNLNRDLTNEQLNFAVKRAINDSIRKAKTTIGRQIRKTYPETAFTPAATNAALIIQRAVDRNLTAKLFVNGRPLPITFFKPKETEKGVSVEIYKGRRIEIKGVFFAKYRGKGKNWVTARGIYENNAFNFRKKRIAKNGPDLPISKLLTLSLPGAVMSDQSEAIEQTTKDMNTHVIGRLRYYIEGIQVGTVQLPTRR